VKGDCQAYESTFLLGRGTRCELHPFEHLGAELSARVSTMSEEEIAHICAKCDLR
jgi:hypothetical protein